MDEHIDASRQAESSDWLWNAEMEPSLHIVERLSYLRHISAHILRPRQQAASILRKLSNSV